MVRTFKAVILFICGFMLVFMLLPTGASSNEILTGYQSTNAFSSSGASHFLYMTQFKVAQEEVAQQASLSADGTGTAFRTLLDASGNIDIAAVNQLRVELNTLNNNDTKPWVLDRYHDATGNAIIKNAGTAYYGECTWWAWGRGYQFAEEKGTLRGRFLSMRGYGNGCDFVSNSSESYETGLTPRPGAFISWGPVPGHVAFVEAVAANGDIVISESGNGTATTPAWWAVPSQDGVQVKVLMNKGTVDQPYYDTSWNSGQHFLGFAYLDKPLDGGVQ